MNTTTNDDFLTMISGAVFSPCRQYRYLLRRQWDESKQSVLFIMLNPSTADETKNDPTVERCQRRAVAMDFGGLRVCNIFAFRATDPKVMKAANDPVGPDNDRHIIEAARGAGMVILGWGAHGNHRGRANEVLKLLRENDIMLHHLGLTKAGQPRHPLYIGYSVEPTQDWILGPASRSK